MTLITRAINASNPILSTPYPLYNHTEYHKPKANIFFLSFHKIFAFDSIVRLQKMPDFLLFLMSMKETCVVLSCIVLALIPS